MSSTKMVAAVALLTLLDEGKLSIDDSRLSRFIREIAGLMLAELPTGVHVPVRLAPFDRVTPVLVSKLTSTLARFGVRD